MEKFALLDFLKVFESLTANRNAAAPAQEAALNTPNADSRQPNSPPVPAPQPPTYENNVMANVLTRHEEIANRIKNKRSV